MSEVLDALDEITGQWTTLLVARICAASELEEQVLKQQINQMQCNIKIPQVKECCQKGLDVFENYPPEQFTLMSKSTDTLLCRFSKNENFPRIFASLFNNTHAIWTQRLIPVSGKEGKSKALHTDKIVNEEQLTKLEKLHCDVFIFLAKIFNDFSTESNQQYDQIPIDIINDVYFYMNHDQPNAVRAAAGDILGSLSVSTRHCQAIIDKFWKQFAACKRDDDYRNFASWVDGVEKLRLTLATPELAESAMQFLNSFISSAKKIERGVLRMKFLAALSVILGRLNKSLGSPKPEYAKALNDIWAISEKWSSKAKHTDFCYQFMCSMLRTCEPSFFTIDHGKKFGENFKGMKNIEDWVISVISEYIECTPEQMYKDKFPEWQTLINDYIFPCLIGGKDQKRYPKFQFPEQANLVIKLITEIGKKQMLPVVDYVRTLFSYNDPKGISIELKKLRLVFIQSLSELARTNTENMGKHNTEFYPVISPILLKKSPGFPDELQYAIHTFPLIHPAEEASCNEIIKSLFEYANGSDETVASTSFLALTHYIEQVATIDYSTKLPVEYINQLLEPISTQGVSDQLHNLSYIYGLTTSLSNAFAKCIDDYNKIKNGAAKITIAEWMDLRNNVDFKLFSTLISNDNDVAQSVKEIQGIFSQQAFSKLDELAFENTYRISKWLQEVPEKKDPLSYISLLNDNNSEYVHDLYVKMVGFYKEHHSKLSAPMISRLLLFLTLVSYKEDETMRDFFNILYKLLQETPNNADVIKAISQLPVCSWSVFLTNMLVYAKANELEHPLFWTQFVNVHYAFIQRKELIEQLEEQASVKDSFRQFLIAFWKVERPNTPEEFANNLKTFQIIIFYCQHAKEHFDTIVTTEEVSQFMLVILNMVDLNSRDQFPTDYADYFINALSVIFETSILPNVDIFKPLKKWLGDFVKLYEANDQSQIKAVTVLTVLLQHNPIILREYFTGSYDPNPLYGSHFIVAMANVFEILDDFLGANKSGDAIVLATILLHLKSQEPILRRSVHKLYGILIVKGKKIFTEEAPIPLIMELTSLTLSGSISQADQFIEFSSKYITPSLAYNIFKIFDTELQKIKDKRQIIITLNKYLPLYINQSSFEDLTSLFLSIVSQDNICERVETADAVRALWYTFIALIKEKFNDEIESFILYVFNYGMQQNDVSSPKSKVSIYALVYTFAEYPEAVANLLIPHILFYDRHVPKDPQQFLPFLKKTDINFKITKEEIFASNCLSEIFLLLESREMFTNIFLDKLAPMIYHALISYNDKSMSIGPFHTLLDTLLDATLFRFADNEKMFTSNLELLQQNNLIQAATSLKPQYSILTHDSGHIIAYDQEAIKTFVNLLKQADEDFPIKFFDIVLACAFQVDSESERSNEPFMFMMALSDLMNTKQLYQLLLFSLYSFKNNKTILVDSLIDNIRQHMMSQTISDETFAEEAFPVIIVFVLYLKLNLKQSLALHIIKNLASVVTRVLELDGKEIVSQRLIEFLQNFNKDEFVASLFVPYIQNLTSFGDTAVPSIITSLYKLAQLLGLSDTEYNWCLLFAIMLDSTQYMIADKKGRKPAAIIQMEGLDYSSPEAFIPFLVEHFTEERYRLFIIEYIGALFQNFKCMDLYKDNVALSLLETFLPQANVVMNAGFIDKVIKILSQVAVSCDENAQKSAASSQEFIISTLKIKVSKSKLTVVNMKPTFVEATFKPIGRTLAHKRIIIDQAEYPKFELMKLAGSQDSQEVVQTLWDLIASKLK